MEAVSKVGPKSEEVRPGCIKLHNEELCDLYTLLRIITVNKSRRMKWAGHGTCMGRIEKHTGFSLVNLKVNNHLEHVGLDWQAI